jgi:Tfp pilus assembly protein PilN
LGSRWSTSSIRASSKAIQRANRDLDREIADLEQRTARLDELRAQLARSVRLEEVVAELNAARTGPLRVMMELSRILSVPGGPTIDPEALERQRQVNPYAGFREGWDVRRLWLKSFTESERVCEIAGEARTNEDVAEFLRRLSLVRALCRGRPRADGRSRGQRRERHRLRSELPGEVLRWHRQNKTRPSRTCLLPERSPFYS